MEDKFYIYQEKNDIEIFLPINQDFRIDWSSPFIGFKAYQTHLYAQKCNYKSLTMDEYNEIATEKFGDIEWK